MGNTWDGLRVREGTLEVTKNTMASNRYGLLIADALFGTYRDNIIVENIETGIALRNSENVEIKGNAVKNNELAGIIIRDSIAVITENQISNNGERGIGIISFAGRINNNNLEGNGLYGIGLEGSGEVDARRNWWGEADPENVIFDSHDDPTLGEVLFDPVLGSPFSFHIPAGVPNPK